MPGDLAETTALLDQAAATLKHASSTLVYAREAATASQALVAIGIAQKLVSYAATDHRTWTP